MPGVADQALLAPYVPHLTVDWLRERPTTPDLQVEGSVVFADISGFTTLTERLARRGKVGAEEIGFVLNLVFEQLLTAAYDYGAVLLKWGGDAVLLLFDGPEHAHYAAQAATAMQSTLRRVGRLRTSAGVVRLGMSIGVHTGPVDLFLVGSRHRELIMTGPAATSVATMEKLADAGEVMLSPSTARALPSRCVGADRGEGFLLAAPPGVGLRPNRVAKDLAGVDLSELMCASLRRHLLAGGVDGEHRHAAVGFIEFAGVDALLATEGSQRVAVALAELAGRVQEHTHAHGVTFLASDVSCDGGKFVLTCGAPTGEGDVEARMLAAVRAILDEPGALLCRAGVTSGRVFAGDFGPFFRRTYSVVGDCVNLAARLMGRAEPGELLATRECLSRSRTTFHTELLPPFTVKGKAVPVEVAVVGAARAASPAGRATAIPLVGRDHELQVLLDSFAPTRLGQGRVVEIVGETGVGKSRLLEELASRTGARLLSAHGDIYGTSSPYLPLQRLLREQLGVDPDAPPDQVHAALLRLVAGLSPRLLAWLPLVGVVAGVDLPSTPEVEAIDESFRHVQLERVTSEVLGMLLDSPTVFAFDDVGFMDDATIGLLRRLVDDVADRPWLMVVTRRPEVPSPLPDATVVHLTLPPLSSEASHRFLELVTEALPLPPHRQDALAIRAGGNPLFLRELVAAMSGTGESDVLPDSVEAVVAARFDRLEPTLRTLLRSAAVLGMEVDLRLLAALIDDGQLPDIDWEALDGFVIREREGGFRFAHLLVRQVAYEGLSYRRRVVLHGRAGDAIEMASADDRETAAALLSLHYAAAERPADAWDWSRLAAQRAAAQWAYADSVEFLERSLQVARNLRDLPDADRATAYEELGDARFVLGEVALAKEAFRRARRYAGADALRAARLTLKSAWICERSGEWKRGLWWLTRGLTMLEGHDDVAARQVTATLAVRYAKIRYHQGHSQQAMQWARRAIALAEACDSPMNLADGLLAVDWAQVGLGELGGDPPARRALAIYRELGNRLKEAAALMSIGYRAFFEGRWEQAMRAYTDAVAAYEAGGDRWNAATASANIAEILTYQGHLGEAADMLDQAMHVWRGTGALSEVAFGTYLQGRIAARSGRYPFAQEKYAESRAYFSGGGELVEVLEVDALSAECLLLQGQPSDALAAAEDAIARAVAMGGVASPLPLLHRVRGHALAQLNRHDAAREALELGLAAARARNARHEIAATLDVLITLIPDSTRPVLAQERDQLAAGLGLTFASSASAAAAG